MANKSILRIEKVKTQGKMDTMYKHNFRIAYCENVDASKRTMNEILVGREEDGSYKDMVEKRVRNSAFYKDHNVRKNAVLGLDVVIAFGDMATVGPEFNLDAWKKQSVEWLEDTFGKDNVASVVLHMDETQPHIHAFVVPMRDGRLNCKHFMGTPQHMRELQDSIADKMENLGLERGARHSVATHVEMKEFYAAVHEALSATMPDCKENETAEQYRSRAIAYMRKVRAQDTQEMFRLRASNAALQGSGVEVKIANGRVSQLEHALKQSEEKLRKVQASAERARQKIDGMLYAVKNQLPDKQTAEEFQQKMKMMAQIGYEAKLKDMQEHADGKLSDFDEIEKS